MRRFLVCVSLLIRVTSRNASQKFNKATIEELQNGTYFYRPTGKGEGRQQFICCSDDLSKLHVFGSYYDKLDKKAQPKEVVLVSEVTEVRGGYSAGEPGGVGGPRSTLALTLVLPTRVIEYEAFTTEEREVWINMLNALLAFRRKSVG